MPRFFVTDSQIGKTTAIITGGDAEHVKVLRMRPGERLVLCDGRGTDYQCAIRDIKPGEVEVDILSSGPCPAEPSVRCTVLAGLPKGERADFIVQKCTEAGASEIVFFLCTRCVARPADSACSKKVQRWQRIAEEAAKQSGRGLIPQVRLVQDLKSALDIAAAAELRLFMYETGERVTIKDAIGSAGSIATAAVITGPEGGFELQEAELARASGCRVCSMGERILRCETAPVVALSALMYATDNL